MNRLVGRSTSSFKAWEAPPGRIRPGTAPSKQKATVNVPFGEQKSYASAQAEMALEARQRLMASTAQGRVAMQRAARHPNRDGGLLHTYADEQVPVPPKVSMAFNAFDRNHSGYLNYKELRNALRHYGLDTTEREAARVLQAYDDQPDGRLSLNEFHRLVTDLRQGMIRANAAPSYDYERLPARVRSAFARFDVRRTGHLSYRELRQALRAYGLDATNQGAARVLAAYDRNPDGRLDIFEFARLVSDLDRGEIKSYTEEAPRRAKEAFQTFDGDADGLISVRELRHALRHYGFDTTANQCGRVLDLYEETPNKRTRREDERGAVARSRGRHRLGHLEAWPGHASIRALSLTHPRSHPCAHAGIDLDEFYGLVQDLELGLMRRPTTPAAPPPATPSAPPTPAAARPATPAAPMKHAVAGVRRPVTPGGHGGPRRPRYDSLVLDVPPEAAFGNDSVPAPASVGGGSGGVDDDRMSVADSVATYDDGEGDVPLGLRRQGQRSMTNNFLRRQLTKERAARQHAEVEAFHARELAHEARHRVDALRLSHAERDLDSATSAIREGLGLSYDGYDTGAGHVRGGGSRAGSGGGGGGGSVAEFAARAMRGRKPDGRYDPSMGHDASMRASSLRHRPITPAAPPQTRGHSLLLRDLHGLEAAILAAVDAKAAADLDTERKLVLIRNFRLACGHNDRYVNRAEFALAIGKFSLGAAPRAGTHKANRHHVLRRPDQPSYDVNHDLVDQLFSRYCEASGGGGERLVDIEAFYGRLKRSVDPDARLTREKTSLEMYAAPLEAELADHPHGVDGHPYGQHPRREMLSMERPADRAWFCKHGRPHATCWQCAEQGLCRHGRAFQICPVCKQGE